MARQDNNISPLQAGLMAVAAMTPRPPEPGEQGYKQPRRYTDRTLILGIFAGFIFGLLAGVCIGQLF